MGRQGMIGKAATGGALVAGAWLTVLTEAAAVGYPFASSVTAGVVYSWVAHRRRRRAVVTAYVLGLQHGPEVMMLQVPVQRQGAGDAVPVAVREVV